MQHYHTDIEHFRQMTIRALSALKSDLSGGAFAEEARPVNAAPVWPEAEPAGKEDSPASSRKGGNKKAASPGWPASDDVEEIETINIKKKS